MTRTNINPPKGSKLEKLVNWLFNHASTEDDLDPNSDHYEARAQCLINEEPRIWKLPRHVARDFIIVPACLRAGLPSLITAPAMLPLLDRLTELEQERAYRTSSANERRAPKPDHRDLIDAIIRVCVLREAGRHSSLNRQFTVVAKDLGISRNVVWRSAKKTFARYPTGGLALEGMLAAEAVLNEMVTRFEAEQRCSKSKRH